MNYKIIFLALVCVFNLNAHSADPIVDAIKNTSSLEQLDQSTNPPSPMSSSLTCGGEVITRVEANLDQISTSIGSELSKEREPSRFIEGCFSEMGVEPPKSFQDAIEFAVDSHLSFERENEFGILQYYQAGDFKKKVSLINSPMCESIDEFFVGGSSTKKKNATTKFKDKQIAFERTYNTLRNEYLQAIEDKKPQQEINEKLSQLKKFYYSLLASLAQHESLSTADTASSNKNAREALKFYNISGYSKPDGVKFYYDKYQSDAHSKRNIGLYQFSASRTGNVSTCIKSWNKTFGENFSSCRLNINNNAELLKVLGSSDQIFNAYCGASKLVQSMGVQVNSTQFKKGSRQRTHKDNLDNSGKLKAPENRCVSLFSASNHTYNHFGTLGHTVVHGSSSNTSSVIDETLGALGVE